MYNEDRKKAFMEWYPSIIAPYYFPNLFARTEFYENFYNKDACDFILSQILDLFRSLAAPSYNSLQVTKSILKTYTNWCTEHSLIIDGYNHYEELTKEMMEGCLNKITLKKKFIPRDMLLNNMEKGLINASDKYVVLAIYEGIRGEDYCELLNLSEEDIDWTNSTFHLCTGRTVKVSRKLLSIAQASTKEFSYYSVKDDDISTTRLKKSSNLAFKPRDNITQDTKEGSFRRLFQRGLRIRLALDWPDMSYPRLFNSGATNMILNYADKFNVAPADIFWHPSFDDIRQQYSLHQPVYQLRAIFKEYLE